MLFKPQSSKQWFLDVSFPQEGKPARAAGLTEKELEALQDRAAEIVCSLIRLDLLF